MLSRYGWFRLLISINQILQTILAFVVLDAVVECRTEITAVREAMYRIAADDVVDPYHQMLERAYKKLREGGYEVAPPPPVE